MLLAVVAAAAFMPSGYFVGPALIPLTGVWKSQFLIPPGARETPNDFYAGIPIVGLDNVVVKVEYHGTDKNGKGHYPVHPNLFCTISTPDHKMVFGGAVDSEHWSTSQSPDGWDRVGDWTIDFQRTDRQPYWLKGEVTVNASEPKSVLKNIRGEKGYMLETSFTANAPGLYLITGSYGYDFAIFEKTLRSSLVLATEGSEFYLHTGVGEQVAMLTVNPASAAKGRVVKLTMQTSKRDKPVMHNLKIVFYPNPNLTNWAANYRNNPQ